MIKLSKKQLDLCASIFGLVAGIGGVFVVNDVAPKKFWGTTAGVATFLLGYVTQRPASTNPTTEQAEEEEINER